MSIIQISKIQQRSGNLVDLPQLDEAEFGWASDAKRLFIGKTTPNENIEVLTSYSQINYSQINGSVGNLNISNINIANGQILTYDGDNWVNRGGNAGGLITLGDVSNVKITGGAIGYVLETDGLGNLSWTPKSTVIAYIQNVTKANPAVVTTTQDNFLTEGIEITITNVLGMTELNGNTFYANIISSNSFSLYSDAGLTTPVNSTGYGTYTSGGRIIAAISGAGGAGGAASGSNTTIQFNNNNLLDGDADFTWNTGTKLLNIAGNANIGNLNASSIVTGSRFISTIATGTAPLAVTSTTRVANLNVAQAGVSDTGTVTAAGGGTYYPVFVGGNTTGNYGLASNAGLIFNASTGTFTTPLLTTTGNTFLSTLGGNVGIGTASPGAKLEVSHSGVAATGNAEIIRLRQGLDGGLSLSFYNSIGQLGRITSGVTSAGAGTNDGIFTFETAIDGTLGEKMRITSPGNVGIGTQTPAAKLDIEQADVAGAGLIVKATSITSSQIHMGIGVVSPGRPFIGTNTTTNPLEIGVRDATDVLFLTDTQERMRITSTGRVGIGANAPDATLTVFNPATFDARTSGINVHRPSSYGQYGSFAYDGDTAYISSTYTGGGAGVYGRFSFQAYDSTSTPAIRMYINETGNVGIGNVAPTHKLSVTGTMNVSGNANVGNIGATTGVFTNISGTLTTGAQTNITSLGTQTSLLQLSNQGTFNTTTPGLTNYALHFTGQTTADQATGMTWNGGTGTTGAQAGIYVQGSGSYGTRMFLATTNSYVTGAITAVSIDETGLVTLARNNLVAPGVQTPILTTGANTTPGTITGNWTLTAGSQLQATYADLAEYYEADDNYEPGTVLMFGGDKEVTLAEDGTSRVAGVVSTNPAYVMNSTCPGLLTAIALQGRVPCKVKGTISKGDMLVSAGDGYAIASENPSMGTVIGKALANFNGDEGIIEVAVGRI